MAFFRKEIVPTVSLAITFVIWLPNIKRKKQVQMEPSTNKREQAKHHKSAWRTKHGLCVYFLQSLRLYTGRNSAFTNACWRPVRNLFINQNSACTGLSVIINSFL